MGRVPARLLAVAIAGSVVLPSVARAADDPPATAAGPSSPFHDKRLGNGMTVVVQEDHRAPLVSLALRYDAGERVAPPGLSGVASLTTFLMLRATKHVAPGEYDRQLARAGAFFVNDMTTTDSTVLEVEVPSDRVELPLWLWSDQMGFFAGGLDETQLELRRTTLEAQRRSWLETSQLAGIESAVEDAIWPEQHPYRNATARAPEDVRKIDRAALLAFHDAWIAPEHATLAIVGDIAEDKAFDLAQKYFGSIVRSGPPHHVERPAAAPLEGQVLLDVTANVPSARVEIRWPTARFMTSEDAHLDLLARVLNGRRTAWLYWQLVDEKKVAQRVFVRQASRDLGSELIVTIEGAPGRTPADLLTAFDASLAELRKRQTSQAVVSIAAYETLVNRAVDLESPRVRARLFVMYSALVGTPDYFNHDFERYSNVPPEVVTGAMTKWMPTDRRVVVLVTPDKSAPVSGVQKGRRFVPAASE
jgi:zinc protease